ncbi:DEAD/DEAH box helicase [Flavilitoribacter nigricans]|uniref:DEAD-box ATP-dependent RNA helicase RhpA n=1 Tax=Flavilitoribacter nigricans (strain ATCC 23147 / DSM 23189 / NBRC 102662 / NCIMB 1420 / SS-2) TaxID=1122177 RepID=A0A2D0N7U5_FLAN2|nr:DEAD/DEAH box helicase [Flavilitoribacter nigricans]PHN04565.1 DEAD/DEAH box helicase [Flavilitoribacter nigricans DSM 23189 = NBRC 102662]
MTFKDLSITPPILKALHAEGYEKPTPIQRQAIPIVLRGKDLLACAQTGTGKTAAFSVPILQHLYLKKENSRGPRRIKALVITPTRELAIQIGESVAAYGRHTGLKHTVIFGGVKQGRQTQALDRGVDILIATPGRLLDLMSQGFITLEHIEYFVLDEADRMLDMGFIHDIRKVIAKLPRQRQSLFFSATMPPKIIDLSRKILGQPEKVVIEPEQTTAEKVEQSVYFVAKKEKIKLLIHLLKKESTDATLVFSRTKHGANRIVKKLDRAGIQAQAIHGNKSQTARQKALGNFKSGDTSVLVATDIAARGIDVEELGLVINYDLPNIPETYVHRIGRTGRAGASGIALSFCDTEERAYLKDIQKTIDQKIPVITEHPFVDEGQEALPDPQGKPKSNAPAANNNNRNKSNRNKRRRYYSRKRD